MKLARCLSLTRDSNQALSLGIKRRRMSSKYVFRSNCDKVGVHERASFGRRLAQVNEIFESILANMADAVIVTAR
jgi:hypothetical protein